VVKIQVVSLKVKKEKVITLKERISFPQDAMDVLIKYIGDSDRENFIVIALDTNLHINCIHTVSIGTLNMTQVHPREVFKIAILANANSIIVGHNHPSGNLTPSNQDIEVTNKLKEAGNMLGIQVIDHIIVSSTEAISLKEKGLI